MKERAELWKKALVMLETVKVNQKKLEEIEELASQIITDLEEAVNIGELPDLHSLYEQESLMIKLQSTLEDIHKGAEELEQLKKEIQSFKGA